MTQILGLCIRMFTLVTTLNMIFSVANSNCLAQKGCVMPTWMRSIFFWANEVKVYVVATCD